MITLSDPFFWLNFIYFFIAVFLAFYIPGTFLLKKLSLSPFQKTVIGIVLGMVLWGWQGYIFGYLNIRWASYLYLFIFLLLWLKNFKLKKTKLFFRFDPIVFVLILIGSFIQISMVWLTGIYTKNGLYFCCGAIHDNVYHLGITYELINKIPPFESGMSGLLMTNYHYWGNLVVGELVRVFQLPQMAAEFQYFTIVISVFLGLLAVIFAQLVKLPKIFAFWLLFFLYFGGDFIYFLQLIFTKTVNLEMGPLENGSSFLMNPPRAFAIIAFFAGLNLLIVWIRKKDFYTGLLMALIFGTLIGFKVYIGIFALSGLFLLTIYYLLKKNLRMIFPLLAAVTLALIVYLPVNKGAGGLFFTYFWRFEEFISQPSLGLSRLELARLVYSEHHNWIRVYSYELFYVFLFIFGIFGSKILGLLQSKKSLSLFGRELNIFLLSGLAVSSILGFFFQQKSGGANSFNFLVSVYIIGSIYTALALSYWFSKRSLKLKFVLISLIVLTTVPRVIYEEAKNIWKIQNNQGMLISNEKLQALNYIREKTPKSSMILPYTTLYLNFLAQRPVFLENEGFLYSHTVDTKERSDTIKIIMEEKDVNTVYNKLIKNNIDYIYLPVRLNPVSTESTRFLEPVFLNKEIKILKFSKK